MNSTPQASSKIQGVIGIFLGSWALLQIFYLYPVFESIKMHSLDLGLSPIAEGIISSQPAPIFISAILLIAWGFEKIGINLNSSTALGLQAVIFGILSLLTMSKILDLGNNATAICMTIAITSLIFWGLLQYKKNK